MKQLILSVVTGAFLWSAFAEARSCRDEPERCPVLRWYCVQPIPQGVQDFMYLSATITSSLFTSRDHLTVKERFCSGVPLTCHEQTSQGRWHLYPRTPQGQLLNKLNGQKVLVNCTEYNKNAL